MKKLFRNPVAIVIGLFIIVFIGSKVYSSSKSSNKVKNNSVNATENISGESTNNEKSVIELTENTFASRIKNGVTLVDFWATWCGPCRMQAPVIEEVSESMKCKAAICKVDVDKNQGIANQYGVQNIPTMLIFKDGEVVGHFEGLTSKEDIINELNKFLK